MTGDGLQRIVQQCISDAGGSEGENDPHQYHDHNEFDEGVSPFVEKRRFSFPIAPLPRRLPDL